MSGGDDAIKTKKPGWPSDAEIVADGWVRISRRERLIQSSARASQYFWIDFPRDAYTPEFVGEHPGVVIRGGKALNDTCIVVPVTSDPNGIGRYTHQLSWNPNPKGQRDGIIAYAICNHLYTVNVCRLRPIESVYGNPIYPRVLPVDFAKIQELLTLALFPTQPQTERIIAEKVESEAKSPKTADETNLVTGRKVLSIQSFKKNLSGNS
jgi:uncharacterized protein YifN (PemK superfamily)